MRSGNGQNSWSDFPTLFFGPNIGPSPIWNVKFFPQFHGGKFPIGGDKIIRKNWLIKAFSNEIKSLTFSRLWPGFYLFWLTKRNTTDKIPGTSTVYWVAWFVYDFRKTKAEICSIWNRVKWQNTRQDRIPDNFGLHKNAIKPIKPVFLLHLK